MKQHSLPHKKSLILLASALALALCAVVGTMAYLHKQTEPVVNTFAPGEAKIEITENFEEKVKTDVAVKNNGTAPVYVRAQVVVTWKNAQGEVSAQAPVLDRDYTMTTGEGWQHDGGGLWYCTQPVPVGASSPVLIRRAEKADGAIVPEGFDLSVQILAQGVQASGTAACTPLVQTVWPVQVQTGGSLALRP